MYFDNFTIREVLAYCSDDEKLECISCGYIDCLLILITILDSFREYLNEPIVITSSYRDSEHNTKAGGSPTSQHMFGQAIDFTCYKIDFEELVERLREFIGNSCLSKYLGQIIVYKSKRIIHIALRNSKHPKPTFYYYE